MRAARRDGAVLRVLATCAPDRGAARLGGRAVQRDRHCTRHEHHRLSACRKVASSSSLSSRSLAPFTVARRQSTCAVSQLELPSVRLPPDRFAILRYFIYIRLIIVCSLPQHEGSSSDVDGARLLMLIVSPCDANYGPLKRCPPPLRFLPHPTEVFLRRPVFPNPKHNLHSHPSHQSSRPINCIIYTL